MKIYDAINSIDSLMFNTNSQKDKIDWLSRMDWIVKRHVIDTHEGGEDVTFTGYNENTAMETELLVPPPYDEVYLRWMEAQIHYHNGEYDKYNAAIVMYNTAFDAYANFYKQNHMPISRGSRFIF